MDSEATCATGDAPDVDSADKNVGRRSALRLAVEQPARFQLGEQEVAVLVADVSETGARLEMDAPPPIGAEGRLLWDDLACACRVVWSAPDAFGVQFQGER